jgi:hypothetical protein
MLANMNYDPAALKARLIQRHGTDIGQIVFDAELNRRSNIRASRGRWQGAKEIASRT